MPETPAAREIRLSRLPADAPLPFRFEPSAAEIASLVAALDLIELRKVRLEGRLIPEGRRDWRLEATLGATAVQPCSVTLAPVTTRIDTPVLRRYLADFAAPTDAEAEMPEDDSLEPLPDSVDLGQVLAESLAIALPDFPRADDAHLDAAQFAPTGVAPLSDADVKPFAGLADLKKRLEE